MPNAHATAKPKSQLPAESTRQLYSAMQRSGCKLVAASGETRPLPGSLHAFLIELLELLGEQESVMIVQDQASLTTVQAAALLGVSRQFLVNLLENGEIPHHKVGTHRRIYAQDLFHYKTQRDGRRHKIIRELAKAEAGESLYGRKPTSTDEE